MTTKKGAYKRSNVVVVIMTPDGTTTKTVQKRQPDLDALQAYVGGPVERVPFFSECTVGDRRYTRGTLYCNEEGKLRSFPLNPQATAAWWKQLAHVGDDFLVGNVVFCAHTDEACE